MTDRNLDDLHPDLKPKAEQFFAALPNAFATETWRDPTREDMLHAQGITQATSENCKHCFTLSDGTRASKAFDFLIKDLDGTIIENGTDKAYHNAGVLAESLGLIWGGRFHHPDPDHIEIA